MLPWMMSWMMPWMMSWMQPVPPLRLYAASLTLVCRAWCHWHKWAVPAIRTASRSASTTSWRQVCGVCMHGCEWVHTHVHGFTQSFYNLVMAGCIPVRIDTYYSKFSFGRVAWPFKQSIQWHKAVMLLPPEKLVWARRSNTHTQHTRIRTHTCTGIRTESSLPPQFFSFTYLAFCCPVLRLASSSGFHLHAPAFDSSLHSRCVEQARDGIIPTLRNISQAQIQKMQASACALPCMLASATCCTLYQTLVSKHAHARLHMCLHAQPKYASSVP